METISADDLRTDAMPTEVDRLAGELGRSDLQMRARLIRADILLQAGETAESGRLAQQVNAWATEHADARLLAGSHHLLAVFFHQVGDMADALAHADQCVTNSGADMPARVRARHLSMLAISLHGNGSPDEARQRFREALDVATAAGELKLSLQVLNNMAYTEYQAGNATDASALIPEMRAFETRYGVPLRPHYLDTIARIEMMHGRYAEAEATLRPVVNGSTEHLPTKGNPLAECLLTVAEAQRLSGDVDRAQQTLDRAVAVCDEYGLMSSRARVREQQAQLYAATGRYREAYEEYRRFHTEIEALQAAQREARARALQAVFETEEARRASERFRELAQRDALTGLYNRRFVDERLAVLLDGAAASRAPLSAALVDLDHFKRINDTLSHATGDVVLQQVAALLAAAVGGAEVAARLGGEEFLLILPDTDADEAVRRCERLRQAIHAHPWQPVTGEIPVSASIGVTTVVDGRSTPSALLAQADRNLYAAKRAGRNRVVADPA
ncbi:diguanylate cyclase [Planosporangium thailandense]|uniref:Diguanylate cyclase n=2 Tax=Planosporangium thailandense TaxID=765197 RepID=A0ABX0Y0P3_9ACTN|nr:GGDEF domain-containing protein [Planosporangium thailandense]NJC71651.1 diguanylate cyclase [Planosporangium thailandense]